MRLRTTIFTTWALSALLVATLSVPMPALATESEPQTAQTGDTVESAEAGLSDPWADSAGAEPVPVDGAATDDTSEQDSQTEPTSQPDDNSPVDEDAQPAEAVQSDAAAPAEDAAPSEDGAESDEAAQSTDAAQSRAVVQSPSQADAVVAAADDYVDPDEIVTAPVTVLSSGVAGISSRWANGTLDMGVNFTVDSSPDGVDDEPVWYDPANVVLSLPSQDQTWPGDGFGDSTTLGYRNWLAVSDPNDRWWRSAPDLAAPESYTENALRLKVDATSLPPEGYPWPTATQAVPVTLVGVTSPDGSAAPGEMKASLVWATRDAPRGNLAWNTAAPEKNRYFYNTLKRAQTVSWAFTAPGVYCVEVKNKMDFQGHRIVEGNATYTVAVGVDADAVTPCAQPEPIPNENDLDDEDRVWPLSVGHTDLKVSDEGDNWAFSASGIPLNDVVWVANGPASLHTVPENSDTTDLSFLGEPGDTYRGFSQSGGLESEALWPGLNASWSSLANRPASRLSWNLTGVTAPTNGDVWVYFEGAGANGTDPDAVLWTSAWDLPQAYSTATQAHTHANWSFTEDGIYCLNYTVSGRMADGSEKSGTAQLTVAVGADIDVDAVVPCGRTDAVGPVDTLPPLDIPAGDEPVIADRGDVSHQPFLSDGRLAVGTELRATTTAEPTYATPNAVVASANVESSGGIWNLGLAKSGTQPTFGWDLTRLTPAQVDGDVLVDYGAFSGPGTVSMTRYNTVTSLKDADGTAPIWQDTLYPGHAFIHDRLAFSAPGVYCLPATLTATPAGGSATTVSQIFTYVVGSEDESSDAYVDRSIIVPCGLGGMATAPGGDGEETDETPTDDRPDSSAIVLDVGHVDVASLIENGRLVTRIKDDTTGALNPLWHQPSDVVFHVTRGAETVVPTSSAYSFLGAPGASVFNLPATQDESLLWPGWSTELIGNGLIIGPVGWSLTDFTGPGEFSLYEQGDFGVPNVLFNTRDGISGADSTLIPQNSHVHGNWAFSAPGTYCLALTRTATLLAGGAQSAHSVLAIAVGDVDPQKVDPADCFAAEGGQPDTTVTIPTDDSAPAAQTATAQTVPATQCVAGSTILSAGHIDYAARIVDGKLESLVKDGTGRTTAWREPANTVLWLKPSSAVVVPGGFGQVAAAGSTVWQIPQSQNPDLIWMGWNTESLNAGNARGAVDFTLNSVTGPGTVTAYLNNALGGVQQVVFDNGGSAAINLGVHAHANWAFSAPGIYQLNFTQSVTLVGGQRSSDTETLRIAVGDVDPATAVAGSIFGCSTDATTALLVDENALLAAAAAEAAEAAAAEASAREKAARSAADSRESFTAQSPVSEIRERTVVILLSVLGGLILLGAVAGPILWRRTRLPGTAVRVAAVAVTAGKR